MAGFTGSMRWARVLVAFVAVAACALLPARAQDTVDQTRQAAAAALSRGAYSEAIPLLQQLVTWLGASKTDGIIRFRVFAPGGGRS